MSYQSVFQRYELKYILTSKQRQIIAQAIAPYMELDKYGRTTVRNIYYDTDNFRLVRQSIEKPVYKEKLRIRSYSKATYCSNVFVELKKKYKSVVYKRRISLPEKEATNWVERRCNICKNTQIAREIDYFLDYYENLKPKVFISYGREAYYAKEDGDFRITFDDNILARESDLTLTSEAYGTLILPEENLLMEIKCSGGIPLWMVRILSENKIYRTTFSKYGTAYKNIILPKILKTYEETNRDA